MTEDLKDYFGLAGKTILVTGASSGIGRECALTLSGLGAHLILIGRNRERLMDAYRNLSGEGHIYFSQDITHYDKLAGVIADSVEKLGRISGFIHAAGKEITLPLRSMKPGYYEDLMAINVIAGFELARIISRKNNFDSEGASFVFIASVLAKLGTAGKIGYSASKGALIPGVKAMALELASKRIRVNCILPGVVETKMVREMFRKLPAEAKATISDRHPLGLGTPEDIACLCTFLLSKGARWITGADLVVDGGYSAG